MATTNREPINMIKERMIRADVVFKVLTFAFKDDKKFLKALETFLSPREEKVIRMRFGIGELSDHTLEEVGEDFEVTRERIRQIESSALEKLWMRILKEESEKVLIRENQRRAAKLNRRPNGTFGRSE